MAGFLRFAATFYLVLVGVAFLIAVFVFTMSLTLFTFDPVYPRYDYLIVLIVNFAIAVTLSIPGIILLSLAQLVKNTSEIARQLRAAFPQPIAQPSTFHGHQYEVLKDGTVVVQTSDGPTAYRNWRKFAEAIGAR